MREVYRSTEALPFLDGEARTLLQEGRAAYSRYELERTPLVEYGSSVALFCWAGDRVMDTLVVQLRDRDLPIESDGIAIVVNDISKAALIPHLRALAAQGPADGVQLAMSVANKPTEKNHIFLNEELLSIDYASARLDTEGAWQTTVRLLAQIEPNRRWEPPQKSHGWHHFSSRTHGSCRTSCG